MGGGIDSKFTDTNVLFTIFFILHKFTLVIFRDRPIYRFTDIFPDI